MVTLDRYEVLRELHIKRPRGIFFLLCPLMDYVCGLFFFFFYLGVLRAKMCQSIPMYSGTSELDTSVQCLAISCAVHAEFEA